MRQRMILGLLRSGMKASLGEASYPYLVSEMHSLIYVPIPKNANSYLKATFLVNHPDAKDFNPKQETALAYLRRKPEKSIIGKSRRMLFDEKYKKIVVWRNPAKRLVSCFLDKFVKNTADMPAVQHFCDDASKVLGRSISPCSITFSDFIRYIDSIPDWRRNPHYRSQS